MKLGNISQTVVQVPKFFINRKYKPMETFELNTNTETYIKFNRIPIKSKKNFSMKQKIKTELKMDSNLSMESKNKNKRNSNFNDRKILTTYFDININNNPRFRGRYLLDLNKEKYLPIYQTNIDNINNKSQTEANNKISSTFYNHKKYIEDNNINRFLSRDLRDELMNDTRNLIDRINMNYDLNAWNKFDTRTTSNRLFQTGYSPFVNAIKNTPNIRDKFINILNKKAMGLTTVNSQVKKNNIKHFYNKIGNENNTDSDIEKSFNMLLDKNKTNLLKLKYNNTSKLEYNEEDKLFIKENERITKRLNKTNIYKEFPSKIREEFNVKKIFKNKELFKINKPLKPLIKKIKYGDDVEFKYFKYKGEKGQNMWIRPLHKDAFKLNN